MKREAIFRSNVYKVKVIGMSLIYAIKIKYRNTAILIDDSNIVFLVYLGFKLFFFLHFFKMYLQAVQIKFTGCTNVYKVKVIGMSLIYAIKIKYRNTAILIDDSNIVFLVYLGFKLFFFCIFLKCICRLSK